MSYADRSVYGYLAVRGVSAEGCNLRRRVGRYRLIHQLLARVIASLQSCSIAGGHFDFKNEPSAYVRYFYYYTVIANYAAKVSSKTEHEQLEVSGPFLNSYQQMMF